MQIVSQLIFWGMVKFNLDPMVSHGPNVGNEPKSGSMWHKWQNWFSVSRLNGFGPSIDRASNVIPIIQILREPFFYKSQQKIYCKTIRITRITTIWMMCLFIIWIPDLYIIKTPPVLLIKVKFFSWHLRSCLTLNNCSTTPPTNSPTPKPVQLV